MVWILDVTTVLEARILKATAFNKATVATRGGDDIQGNGTQGDSSRIGNES